MKRITNNQSGFTLMELLVSMTIFLVVLGLSSGIFLQTLRSQRAVVGITEAMNNVTLALEQIAREARTGFAFESEGQLGELRFRNGFGNYVAYGLIGDIESGVIGRCESPGSAGCDLVDDLEPITSADVKVDSLKFFLQNNANQPPLVTVAIGVELDKSAPPLVMQTSVSSRIINPGGNE
ncbi:MAG: prepilin-type N-terminal cleavage/methylation domain-containing protein [bacterium]|nr:prepilin-type N-terminal cleavage/methylation domain-containing protein [bacterium]MDZ4231180.1 prepilin-type N-terminal cleavage/methylation domain-containing protein [Patescibacteria group bacterium]